MKPALVVLAAGASSRLGRCKALVDLGGRTALEHLLEAARALDRLPACVVAGAHHDEIARWLESRALEAPPVELLHHSAWAAGRTGSVQRAVRARPGADLVVAPVDCPLVPEAVFAGLLEAWSAAGAPARGWLAPGWRGATGDLRRGHPVVVGRGLAEALLSLGPDVPLREARAAATPAWTLRVETPAILDDLDGPGDLVALRARLAAD